MKISVVIHTYNADQFLDQVLNAVKTFDEIIICDMYSSDKTIEIANKYNCKILHFEYTGGIPEPARQYAISQAKYEWVFVVDADELVTPDLISFLYHFKENFPEYNGARIPRKNFFMGKFMHCAYPDYILRFFKKDKTKWPPQIHSKAKVEGKVYTIPEKETSLAFIHLSDEPISVTIEKMNRYTAQEAVKRHNKKYTTSSLFTEPLLRFLRFFVFKGGFRDGKAGFIWACMYAYYKFVTIVKVLESKNTYKDKDLL